MRSWFKMNKAPADIELRSALGLTHLMMGQAKKAIKIFKALPKAALERQDIANYTALSYYLSGKYLQTLETLKNQETATLKEFRQITKRLKELANEKIKLRGQS